MLSISIPTSLSLLALPCLTLAALSRRDLQALLERPVQKEYFPAPAGWRAVGPPPTGYLIELQIGLQQSNLDQLAETLLAVSDPSSPRYGNHLTQSEVSSLIAPSSSTTERVHAWLAAHGIDPVADNKGSAEVKDWITVELPVERIEGMLGAKYHTWEHQKTGTKIVRTESWGLPRELHAHVEVIQPTTKFLTLKAQRAPFQILDELDFEPVLPLHLESTIKGLTTPSGPSSKSAPTNDDDPDSAPLSGVGTLIPGTDGLLHSLHSSSFNPSTHSKFKSGPSTNSIQADDKAAQKKAKAKATASCDQTMTIGCLRDMYAFGAWNGTAKSKSVLGIASFLNQYANYADLRSFLNGQRPEAAKSKFAWVGVNKGKNPQALERAGTEASLDVQYGLGMSWPLQTVMYSVGGKAEEFTPDAAEPTNGNEPYAAAVQYWLGLSDAALPKVISTSYGDDEQTVPSSYANRVCNSFAQLGVRGVSMLFASGDGGVGGLAGDSVDQCISNDGKNKKHFLPTFPSSCPWITSVGATVGTQEKATTRFASGAGFSNYFGQPSYQKNAVTLYLKSIGNIYPGLYNKTGRASPDVAAAGDNFLIYVGGSPMVIGGTSASTPVFAAAIAVLNDYRLSKGKKTLGFLNPWIYSKGSTFLKDITVGSSFGCQTKGFPAKAGWDAVTGLGTPNVAKMLKNLPA